MMSTSENPSAAPQALCECECGCRDVATQTDDGGAPVCEECADYVTDGDDEVVCSRSDRTEYVADGAGGVVLRLIPPPEPAVDPNGEWACYWATVGDDDGPAGRYATRQEAAQAVDAKDWPHPDDHTQYLCGWEVRHLVDSVWVLPDEDE